MAIFAIENGWQVEATQVVKYRACKVDNLLSRPVETAHYFGAEPCGPRAVRRLFVLDQNVERLYGGDWRNYCAAANIAPAFLTLECRESLKNDRTVATIIDALMEFGLSRDIEQDEDKPQIEVWGCGGGVLHDVLGMAMMEFDRGIYDWGFIGANTLAALDAGYGGKVMIDYAGRKNARGGIKPPKLFIADLSLVKTVPKRHVVAGLAEAAKVGTFHDRVLLRLLYDFGPALVRGRLQPTRDVSQAAIDDFWGRSVFPMLEEQGENLWVREARRWQEGGHDAAHEWEVAVPDALLHGECVSMNIAVITFIAEARRICDGATAEMIRETLFRIGLPLYSSVMEDRRYIERALRRAVAKRGTQAIPLPTTGGYLIADDLVVTEYMTGIGQARCWVSARHGRML